MIEREQFPDKQMELLAEFAQYVVDHPEVDELMPAKSNLCFEIAGEAEFNRYSREGAQRSQQDEGGSIVVIRIKGLAPPRGSRLIDPIIEATTAVA